MTNKTLAAVSTGAAAVATAAYLLSTNSVIQPWTPPPLALHACSFEWNQDADVVAGYRIYYGIESGFYPTGFDTGTNLTATISNLCPGLTYYFTVTAIGTNGDESDPAPELPITLQSQDGWAVLHFRFAAGTPHSNDVVEQSYDLASWTNSPYSVIAGTNHDGSAADCLSPIDPTKSAVLFRIRL